MFASRSRKRISGFPMKPASQVMGDPWCGVPMAWSFFRLGTAKMALRRARMMWLCVETRYLNHHPRVLFFYLCVMLIYFRPLNLIKFDGSSQSLPKTATFWCIPSFLGTPCL